MIQYSRIILPRLQPRYVSIKNNALHENKCFLLQAHFFKEQNIFDITASNKTLHFGLFFVVK